VSDDDEALLEQERLALALEEAGAVASDDPSSENLAAHNDAAVALHDHRSKLAVAAQGPNSGGATIVTEDGQELRRVPQLGQEDEG
jgi:hypothetical protein